MRGGIRIKYLIPAEAGIYLQNKRISLAIPAKEGIVLNHSLHLLIYLQIYFPNY